MKRYGIEKFNLPIIIAETIQNDMEATYVHNYLFCV